jgi:hypothetical protein
MLPKLRAELNVDYLLDAQDIHAALAAKEGEEQTGALGAAVDGKRCSTAPDPAACDVTMKGLKPNGCWGQNLVYRRGAEIGIAGSATEFLKLAGTIDGPAKAQMLVLYRKFTTDCRDGWYRQTASGIELQTNVTLACHYRVNRRAVVLVTPDGDIIPKAAIDTPFTSVCD